MPGNESSPNECTQNLQSISHLICPSFFVKPFPSLFFLVDVFQDTETSSFVRLCGGVCTSSVRANNSTKALPLIITLAISKCYGNVRIFFPGDNSLISDRKSHNSDFFGLVVRCLLFNPEGLGSNPCLCTIFFTSCAASNTCNCELKVKTQ